jgi:hypothetical protein
VNESREGKKYTHGISCNNSTDFLHPGPTLKAFDNQNGDEDIKGDDDVSSKHL